MVDRNNEHPQQPQTQPAEVIGDVGHSGNLSGPEKDLPVFDFRNPDGTPMTLDQAVKAGVVQTTPPRTLGEHSDPTDSQTELYRPLLPPEQPPQPEQPVAPPTPEKRPQSKKGIAAIAAGAVASVVIGGFGAVKFFGGDDTPKLRSNTSTSTPETPGTQPTVEVTDPTEGLDILNSSGTGAEVQAEFSEIISRIVNQREDAGNVQTDNADLQYLTNVASGVSAPGVMDFQKAVGQWTTNLETFRELMAKNEEVYEKENGYNIVDPQKATFKLVSEIQTVEANEYGGFTIETKDHHLAMLEVEYPDGRKETLEGTTDGTSNRRYTFNRQDVILPNGDVKNTFVLAGFETLPDDSSAQ